MSWDFLGERREVTLSGSALGPANGNGKGRGLQEEKQARVSESDARSNGMSRKAAGAARKSAR